MGKRRKYMSWFLLLVLIGPLWVGVSGAVSLTSDWRTASRQSAGLAPQPSQTRGAVVQVYAARAFNWRGLFAVHTWIAVKAAASDQYVVHQVLGWNEWRGLSVVDSRAAIPDRYWYGAKPDLLLDIRGDAAEALIEEVNAAVRRYPYTHEYRLWPGPNSNTFVAWVAREVPALGLSLPVTAIGKDYLGHNTLWAPAPSGTGGQFSLFGGIGMLAALEEGLEINLLGLVVGVDPLGLAVKLPGIGRVGVPRNPRPGGSTARSP